LINSGKSPIVEEKIEEFIRQVVLSGKLRATTNTRDAVNKTDIAIVCVGTPSKEDLEETSGKIMGSGIDVVFHPEFLREGSSVKDFYEPPKIVIGERIQGIGKPVMNLYKSIKAPRHFCSLEVAEIIKYADNLFHAVKITFANEIGLLCHSLGIDSRKVMEIFCIKYADNLFHAVKITFANEIGLLCHSLGIDSRKVMEIFCTDTKLNISKAYLRPGFAFGGSCLPKDLRAILALTREGNVKIPMMEHVMISNQSQIERALQVILKYNSQIIGFFGLAFKPGTDDLRESPLVELAERLLGKGFDLRIRDEFIQTNRLFGKNKAYIQKHLPHLAGLMVDSTEELIDCDTILVGHPANDEVVINWLEAGIQVIDLTGENLFPKSENYHIII